MTRLQKSLPGIVSVTGSFIIWEAYCRLSGMPALILPAPTQILAVFFDVMSERSTFYHLSITLWEILAGFSIATVAGVFLGWLIYVSPIIQRALHPFIVASQVVPKVALVPLFVLWFGFGPASKIIVAAVIAFFPVMVNTHLGLRSVEDGHKDVFKALRANPFQRIMLLQIPSALPAILAGMEMAIVLATIGAVVGEYLGGSEGLGYLAVATMNAFQTDRLFVLIILLTLIGFSLFIVIATLRRMLTAWHSVD
ncbi:ABC transporter permease [Chelativorans sp. Marseille-P2723]|uniref:ABC transporter permease n=1 Tax=Chelativorans sp. Marseille-P2723 TaxID=2709133 RepID=UPI00156E67D5|nr:ABC transporter permease [Chelativorans sp. Marseille-P2723]